MPAKKRLAFFVSAATDEPARGALAMGVVLAIAIAGAAGGCQKAAETQPSSRSAAAEAGRGDPIAAPVVLTVNYPLEYMAQRVAGDAADVRYPGPQGRDPAHWRPAAEDIRGYQEADLILDNGAHYAKWLTAATLPDDTLIDVSARVKDQFIVVEDFTRHSHGDEDDHFHAGTAPTLWLDPRLAMEQAARIADALQRVAPGRQADLQAALRALHADLQALDEQLEKAFEPSRGEPWLASHPVYPYLARRYGLNMVSLHFEPNQTPTPEQWKVFDELLKKHPAMRMLWEDEPTAETRTELEARGIQVIVFRTCDNRPSEGDFLSQMKANADNIR